jgi:hypothetical protein
MKSNSIAPSSKSFKCVSKVILQDNQNSIEKTQKEFDKVVVDKDKEISCLKNHNQSVMSPFSDSLIMQLELLQEV